jgi:hypothetical protein
MCHGTSVAPPERKNTDAIPTLYRPKTDAAF